MAWTPESGLQLSEALDLNAIEETTAQLWHEFLSGYFDGATHYAIPYPAAELLFGQGKLTRPLDQTAAGAIKDGVAIQWVNASEHKHDLKTTAWGRSSIIPMTWTFHVRAVVKRSRADGQNAHHLCRWTTDLLHSLLLKPDCTVHLARAGIGLIRPRTGKSVSSVDFALRTLSVGARLIVPHDAAPTLSAGYGQGFDAGEGEILASGPVTA